MMWSKSFLQNIPGLRFWCLLFGSVVIIATGCGGAPSRYIPTQADSPDVKAPVQPKPHTAKSIKKTERRPSLEQRLRGEVRQWQGTPHKMGGNGRRGIDCSGFVHYLYRDIFNRKIPRSTALLVKSGHPIGKSQLRTGDLVFFQIPYKGRHVGIYLGDSEFAHASTSKGVMISSLDDPYWRLSYWTARRYLKPSKG